jgi:predicted protein tyrosine phosphatase
MRRERLLFVCSANIDRSPTAESLFAGSARYEARSAGTSPDAKQKLTGALVAWADRIFVMEDKHAAAVRERFANELDDKPLIVLAIPDIYQYREEPLIAELSKVLDKHIDFTV